MSLEEEGLAQRAVTLVAGVEPFANTGNMEFVLAVAALHGRQRTICGMEHAVADGALLHTFSLFVDVALPLQDG
jgi:hypothetical protein